MKKYGGWSPEGIDRFNELYDLVKANRESEKAKGYPFEEAFHIYSLELFNDDASSNKRKRDDADSGPVRTVSVKNDLWSDDEDDANGDDDASEGSTENENDSEEEVEEDIGIPGPVTQSANV